MEHLARMRRELYKLAPSLTIPAHRRTEFSDGKPHRTAKSFDLYDERRKAEIWVRRRAEVEACQRPPDGDYLDDARLSPTAGERSRPVRRNHLS